MLIYLYEVERLADCSLLTSQMDNYLKDFGFTKQELDEAFDKVHFPTGNWKDPIFCRVHKKDLKAVKAAIIVNCGCVADTGKDEKDDWEDMYFVKADGYYLSVGA